MSKCTSRYIDVRNISNIKKSERNLDNDMLLADVKVAHDALTQSVQVTQHLANDSQFARIVVADVTGVGKKMREEEGRAGGERLNTSVSVVIVAHDVCHTHVRVCTHAGIGLFYSVCP